MPYVSTRTWLPGDTFPHTDHNTYIRDNLKAIRTFQHVGQPVASSSVALTGSPVTMVSLLNIEPANIDEPWMLQVVALCSAENTPSTGGINITMQDNVGAALTVIPTFMWMPTVTGHLTGIAVGTKSYTANSAKPGFTVKFQDAFSTGGIGYCIAFCYCRPTTTIVKP